MIRHKIHYSDEARSSINTMPPYNQSTFYSAIEKLARDPYGMDSTFDDQNNCRNAPIGNSSIAYRVFDSNAEMTIVSIISDGKPDRLYGRLCL